MNRSKPKEMNQNQVKKKGKIHMNSSHIPKYLQQSILQCKWMTQLNSHLTPLKQRSGEKLRQKTLTHHYPKDKRRSTKHTLDPTSKPRPDSLEAKKENTHRGIHRSSRAKTIHSSESNNSERVVVAGLEQPQGK